VKEEALTEVNSAKLAQEAIVGDLKEDIRSKHTTIGKLDYKIAELEEHLNN